MTMKKGMQQRNSIAVHRTTKNSIWKEKVREVEFKGKISPRKKLRCGNYI